MKIFIDFDGCVIKQKELTEDFETNHKILLDENYELDEEFCNYVRSIFQKHDEIIVNTARSKRHKKFIRNVIMDSPLYGWCVNDPLTMEIPNQELFDVKMLLAMLKLHNIYRLTNKYTKFVMIEDDLEILTLMKQLCVYEKGAFIHYIAPNKFICI